MTDRSPVRRSGVPWWAPLLALAVLAAGVAAVAASSSRDAVQRVPTHAVQRVPTHAVLGTHATVTKKHVDRSLLSGGQPLFPARAATLRALSGRYAVARGVRVLGVVGPRIFWVGDSTRSQILVHLQGRGTRYAIRTGQRLAFTAVVTRNAAGSASAWGLTFDEGLGRLRAQGMHLEVYGPRIRFF